MLFIPCINTVLPLAELFAAAVTEVTPAAPGHSLVLPAQSHAHRRQWLGSAPWHSRSSWPCLQPRVCALCSAAWGSAWERASNLCSTTHPSQGVSAGSGCRANAGGRILPRSLAARCASPSPLCAGRPQAPVSAPSLRCLLSTLNF